MSTTAAEASTASGTTGDHSLRVEVVRSVKGVEALREPLAALRPRSITADLDYYLTVIASEENAQEPLVLAAYRGHVLQAALLVRVEQVRLVSRLGYLPTYRPKVRSLTVVYRGDVGPVDEALADLFLRTLTELVDGGEADVVLFRHLDLEHPLYRVATTRPSFITRQHHGRVFGCWELTLPGSFEAFLGSLSRSTRSGVKRYLNKLERDFEGRLDVRKLTLPDEIDDYFRDVELVAARTYQRGLGVGVHDNEAHRLRVGLVMRRGWFRSYILYLDGRPVAFCGGDVYAGRFRYGIPGYDPALSDYRIGNYVLMKMIADLCEDETVDVLDFGFGDAEYKRRFGDRTWREADVLVFARRARPIAINFTRTGILKTADAMNRVARRLGVFDRVKQRWRRHAAAGTSGG